jgi:carboxypeptidase C (cathepsin A)
MDRGFDYKQSEILLHRLGIRLWKCYEVQEARPWISDGEIFFLVTYPATQYSFLTSGDCMRSLGIILLLSSAFLVVSAGAQQPDPAQSQTSEPAKIKGKQKTPRRSETPESNLNKSSENTPGSNSADEPRKSDAKKETPDAASDKDKDKEEHYDVTEVAPVITQHQITADGKLLKYTATTGRLPIKRGDGKVEAEVFFVAYTLNGSEIGNRPITFAFNGGPGSASIWLHLGALGPKRVVMQPNGFMPAPPFHLADNQNTLLSKSDIVMVDAIGTGFSRAANAELAKKYWGVKGDIEAFSEFIRLYITRYQRWSSPLFLLGESYGTTRGAGIAGYLADRGVAFNGITLLSMALSFQTLVDNKSNDEPYILLIPTFTMIAAYHKKLSP